MRSGANVRDGGRRDRFAREDDLKDGTPQSLSKTNKAIEEHLLAGDPNKAAEGLVDALSDPRSVAKTS